MDIFFYILGALTVLLIVSAMGSARVVQQI